VLHRAGAGGVALTDEVTRLGPDGVTDDVWDAAAKEFRRAQLADLVIAIATINVWNRIAVSTRIAPGT
jgi:alkylhydroperoxidase family enzyme